MLAVNDYQPSCLVLSSVSIIQLLPRLIDKHNHAYNFRAATDACPVAIASVI
jgi:hypothetical protein